MSQELLDNRGKGLASWSMPPVHPEGRKFAVAAAAMTLIFALLAWETLAWPMAGITLWILAFFRDPARVTPLDERLVVAPADGLCTMIELVPPPVELAGAEGLGTDPMYRVSIFMSVFDVHINRAPIGGTIRRIVYISGKFLNADLDKASDENERQHIMIERSDGARIGFTQIAGLVARRIVPFIKEGDFVAVGQRVGLIRFGSRVDVYLPQGTAPAVVKGQRIVAGETILAVIGETPVREGISH
ncbi:MAG: phosphatidylserine decarboxylase [Blastomonas sp.]|uniref:phosphatidylserine decarboxylase n=1 Tax=Blastomonas sp. TaxID=1909299 RepID=UPI002584119E|nr:phosphatidylserine decarboxylase [Blastomonas sp.]MCO5793233.1 phosphatidylserine decarboxylase [Blastomonas sp.]